MKEERGRRGARLLRRQTREVDRGSGSRGCGVWGGWAGGEGRGRGRGRERDRGRGRGRERDRGREWDSDRDREKQRTCLCCHVMPW